MTLDIFPRVRPPVRFGEPTGNPPNNIVFSIVVRFGQNRYCLFMVTHHKGAFHRHPIDRGIPILRGAIACRWFGGTNLSFTSGWIAWTLDGQYRRAILRAKHRRDEAARWPVVFDWTSWTRPAAARAEKEGQNPP